MESVAEIAFYKAEFPQNQSLFDDFASWSYGIYSRLTY